MRRHLIILFVLLAAAFTIASGNCEEQCPKPKISLPNIWEIFMMVPDQISMLQYLEECGNLVPIYQEINPENGRTFFLSLHTENVIIAATTEPDGSPLFIAFFFNKHGDYALYVDWLTSTTCTEYLGSRETHVRIYRCHETSIVVGTDQKQRMVIFTKLPKK